MNGKSLLMLYLRFIFKAEIMRKFIFTAFLLILYITIQLSAQEASKWRGPEGNGIYPDKGLLKQWPQNGPEIIWTFDDLGQGFSSPVIANGNIFISTMLDNTGYIYKLSLNGKLIWKATYAPEFTESYPGTRASVTVAGDLLYILSGLGKLVCMNSSDGKVKWTKDLFKDFDGKNITWGLNETVVVDGDKLYCTPGGKKQNMVALNRQTGNLIWSSPGKGEKSGYCTPLLIKLPTRSLLVTHTESSIIGVDASNGKFLWSYPHPNQYSVHPNTPIYKDGLLFCHSGYGQGGVMLKLSSDGSSVEKLWTVKSFDSRIGASVLVGGYLYGSGDTDRSWQCLEWISGKKMYSSTAIAKGAVIYADGLLYCYSERGELAIVKADPAGFNVISKTQVTKGSEQHWAHPVINDGVLYVHHGSSLIAYKIK
jgi:outer membrane protein assembly factor BamB